MTSVGAQLADILGSLPPTDVVARLFDRSEGNPLFTEELLAGGLDGRGALPPTLREALLTRLERLSPDARRSLSVLSVAGQADEATLAAASGLEGSELNAGLREALAAHVLDTDEADRFRFRHALFREVLYDDLLPGERSELHLTLARTLAARSDAEQGAWLSTAIAHHYHRAGEQAEALRAAVEAADSSERVHAYGEAAGLLDRALGLWSRVPDAERLAGVDLPDLMARAARDHYLSADDARGAALLEHAIAELDPDREPLRVARLLGELADTQWSLGEARRSRETLERALALLPEEPTPEGARLLAHQVRFRALQGRFGEVEEIAIRAIEMCDALGLDDVKASVMHRLGFALFPLGESERGEALLRESVDLARRAGTERRARVGVRQLGRRAQRIRPQRGGGASDRRRDRRGLRWRSLRALAGPAAIGDRLRARRLGRRRGPASRSAPARARQQPGEREPAASGAASGPWRDRTRASAARGVVGDALGLGRAAVHLRHRDPARRARAARAPGRGGAGGRRARPRPARVLHRGRGPDRPDRGRWSRGRGGRGRARTRPRRRERRRATPYNAPS